MKVVYNLTKEPSKSVSGKEVKIYEGDINIIYEIFQVVAFIRGGLISSASKEFNEVLARLSSRTVPPHLLSIISESKRKNNIEANINFLIKLFFPPNNLFFLSGRLPYYIHSSQRNCPIYTIVKQETYDNDSYLTCLKLFLQSETDFKNKDNMNNLRVGCAVKKKLITDNFSAVWDNFWSDLVQSEEQTEFDDDLERVGVATEEATAKKKDGDDGDDDEDDNALCLVKAIQSGDQMYSVGIDWDIGEYYPISYKDIYYNISPNGNYKFNNEFFHHLNLNELPLVPGALGPPAPPTYTGFECMKYYKNGNNPVLFLGGNTGVFKLDLKTYKLTRFITAATTLVFGGGGAVTPVVKCMDILDVEEGYMLVGGNFTTLTTFDYNYVNNAQIRKFTKRLLCYAAMINLKTYEIINLYDDSPVPLVPVPVVVNPGGVPNPNNVVSKICICKNKKIIKKKGLGNQEKDIYGYIAMIGGFFQIMTVTNDNNPPPGPPPALAIEKIINIGCVLININNAAAPSARLLAVDSKASLVDPAPANIVNSSGILQIMPLIAIAVPRVLVTSIVCNENEVDNDYDDEEKKKETVFFIGGYFNAYTYIDYPAYEAAKAAVGPGGPLPPPVIAFGNCNSIIKLTLSCEYDNDDVISKYNQKSIFEPIDVGNNDRIFYASLVYKEINSKKYLFCLTGFIRVAVLPPAPANAVYTRLNIFDVESKVNYQTPQDITYNGYVQVVSNNYMFQTLLLTVTNNNNKNNKNNAVSKDDEYVLMISFTTLNGAGNRNYIGTCNVSNLNKNPATPVEIEIVSAFNNINPNIPNNDSVTDMCVIKNNTNDNVNAFNVFVSHKNSSKPLTVRSNYQEIGDWNMMSASTDNENDKLSMFIKKILEMKKMFELNPSMFLFLQNIDMRDYNTRITKIVLDNMRANLLVEAGRAAAGSGIGLFNVFINAVGASSIDIFSACNDIDQKIMNIVNFIYIYKTTTENLIPVVPPANLNIDAREIHIKIYNFINDLIFILVYVGCNSYAETICSNYVKLILVPRAGVPLPPVGQQLDRGNWRVRFTAIITTYIPVLNQIIDMTIGIANKYKSMLRVNLESPYYFKVCSDPDTDTGIAYLIYNFNLNLNTLLTYKNQKNLQNKIYEYGTAFFDDNEIFHKIRIVDDIGNTHEQINFCSFYKFERNTAPPAAPAPFGDIGSMDSDTIYVSVNVNIDEDKIKSSEMFEYLKIIKNYFMKLRTGQPIVEIGISGPIRRIIFGGDFGCNLLHDAEVCKKFELEKMKIYTRTDNKPNYVNDIKGANHIFVIDADLEPVAAQGGGGGGGGAKRITIGECIEERRVAVGSNKRRTRRKVPS